MPPFETAELRSTYHKAILEWREKNFPEYRLLEENWSKHFGTQTPFALTAKIGKMKSDKIELGEFTGQEKYTKAGEMVGNMFYSARNIIRAQCSTELGSIQQHRMTLEAPISDAAKYAVLRIMAEELRHAYQMFWVFDQDDSWDKPGHGNIAKDTIEELLAMTTGTHVLDAFNIEFYKFLDNAMFATVIDLVGKYQLEMQRIFAYAPMAQSMQPMLSEEGFHMASGRNIVKEIALIAQGGKGDYSIPDVQKALNQWLARGLEMFGSEAGGTTAVHFGFKDKMNGQAQNEYYEEVKKIFEDINVALVVDRLKLTDRDEARALVRKISETRNSEKGVGYEDLIHVPSTKFFRRRGMEDYTLKPIDVDGNLSTENGKPLSAEKFFSYLEKNLPERYLKSGDYVNYKKLFKSGGLPTGFLV
jgi:benzoyl-CoA 2,3-epoxidase subunit B